MDLQIQIIIAVVILVSTIVLSIKRNHYLNFLLGYLLLSVWMLVTISIPFLIILVFSVEAIVLFLLAFTIYTIYMVRSNFFIASSLSLLTDDNELIKLDKAIRLQVKAIYLTMVNTTVIVILILGALGIITLSPLVGLASIWAIPLALLGVVAGILAFGVLMIGLIPSIVVNLVFTINGVAIVVNALGYERKDKVKHILFSLIPYYGIVDGIRLSLKAKKKIESNGFKFNIRKLRFIEDFRE